MSVTLQREELRALLSSPIEVAELLGLPYQREGQGNVKVLCPAHDDHNPSCALLAGQGGLRAYCRSCAWSTDVFGFIAQVRGLDVRKDFRAVLQEASALATGAVASGTPLGQRAPGAHRSSERLLSDERYHEIAYQWLYLCGAWEEQCADEGLGYRYLRERGLAEQAHRAGVVAVPEQRDERGVRSILGQLRGSRDHRTFTDAELGADGADIAARSNEFRWPDHVVLIPWVDGRGAITCVQRRYVGADDPPIKYVFPKGRSPQQPFGIRGLRQDLGVEVVIVEGALDALARRELASMRSENIDVLGIPSASSPLVGLPLDALASRRVVIATDNDDAGHSAARALLGALEGIARELVREVPASGAKDWGNELVLRLNHGRNGRT